MSEKFSLQWNDFQSNVSRSFSLLRSEEEFFDVSLVSDDQKMMSAHKLVLSASSPYFKHILTHNKHSHPLLWGAPVCPGQHLPGRGSDLSGASGQVPGGGSETEARGQVKKRA